MLLSLSWNLKTKRIFGPISPTIQSSAETPPQRHTNAKIKLRGKSKPALLLYFKGFTTTLGGHNQGG
jgi:hypothetical protein